ncbi:MAG: hypothetical protein IVW54_22895 [Candidatus Binataceae bacterium]|nr:hypothetical protein [Candidatus Binataceae bacterium]
MRAARVPGFGESLLSRSRPSMRARGKRFIGIELEAVIVDPQTGNIAGFTDGLLKFDDGTRLWLEIKSEDTAIGALVRQVKMYKRLIKGDSANWLAVLPEASVGAAEFLAHAQIGTYVVRGGDGLPDMSDDLFSASARRNAAGALAGIPEAMPTS